MKRIIIIFTMVFTANTAFAELPVSVSIDTKGGYDFTDEVKYVENEIVIEKCLDFLNGFSFGLDNTADYVKNESDEKTDELAVTLNLGLFNFLSIGAAQKTLFAESEDTDFGISGTITLGYEFKKISFFFVDENELLYNISDEITEYTNTFSINQKLFNIGSVTLGLYAENEYVRSEGEYEDSILCGPTISYGFFTGYINYTHGIHPESTHGVELGIIFEF